MPSYTETDRVMALAGVVQAACLARDIARQGACNAQAFAASRDTLFDFDPESVASVFGGPSGVASGLRALHDQLAQPRQRDLEISRYLVALIHLADRLQKNQENMRGLRDDLDALARRLSHFDLGDSAQHQQLAQVYQDRISTLGPRIMVRGEPLHLQNAENAARIRVALLTGIRAAVLWRQAGGSKLQLLFRRRKIVDTVRELVDTID